MGRQELFWIEWSGKGSLKRRHVTRDLNEGWGHAMLNAEGESSASTKALQLGRLEDQQEYLVVTTQELKGN